MAASAYCHLDETRYPRADCGGKGHAWAAACRWAAMIIFHRSRSADIFDEALAFLRGSIAVVDGYPLYRAVLGEIQRCWRHVINNLKAAAARATGPEAAVIREMYTRLCSLYERIKDKDTASKAERDSIVAQARAIAEALPEDHPSRIEILNAGDALVTFLKYADMPPTNNFDEGVIRRGPVVHRNVRYLIRNEEGARVLSTLVSFHITCRLQGLDTAGTLLRILRGEDPRRIFKTAAAAAGAGPDRSQKPMRHAVAQLLLVQEGGRRPAPQEQRPAPRNLPVPAQAPRPAPRNLPVPAQAQAAPTLLPVLWSNWQELQLPQDPAKLARQAARKVPRVEGAPRPPQAAAKLAPASSRPTTPSPPTRPAPRIGQPRPLATARRQPPRPPRPPRPRHHARNRQVPIEPPVPPPRAPSNPPCRDDQARSGGR